MEQFPLRADGTYEGTQIEGGIEAFADILKPDRSRPEQGQHPIPSPESCRRYARKVVSIEESMAAADAWLSEEENLLAS